MAELISYEPATGAVLWRGQSGDVDAEVAAARASWAAWASHPLTYRIEAMRRFANVVRGTHEAFADLLARETGKPLWEARTEIASVIAKVDISVAAYAARTAQRRLDAPLGRRLALHRRAPADRRYQALRSAGRDLAQADGSDHRRRPA